MNILRRIANALSGTVFYFVRGAVCKLAFVVCALSGLFPVFALEKRAGGRFRRSDNGNDACLGGVFGMAGSLQVRRFPYPDV